MPFFSCKVLRGIAQSERSDADDNGLNTVNHRGSKSIDTPNYANLYEYLSELFMFARVPQRLDNGSAAVILDMIICLLQATDYLLSSDSATDLEQTFSDIREKVSVLVSALTVSFNQRLEFLKRMFSSKMYDVDSLAAGIPQDFASACTRPNALPCPAPLIILRETRFPLAVGKTSLLKKALKSAVEMCWQFPTFDKHDNPQNLQERLAEFVMNPLGVDSGKAPSVCHLFSTTSLLLRHYEEAIISHFVRPPLLTAPKPFAVRRALAKSAAKLLATAQPCKTNLVRRVSQHVTKQELDRYINSVHVPRSDAPPTAMRTKMVLHTCRRPKNQGKIGRPELFLKSDIQKRVPKSRSREKGDRGEKS
uniref:Conserved oligomeric Golgi complex subunit 7 n=1 Tax=Mesocestoides corti TaxID=53468 RepID=A0A5K3EKQ9_MESCO